MQNARMTCFSFSVHRLTHRSDSSNEMTLDLNYCSVEPPKIEGLSLMQKTCLLFFRLIFSRSHLDFQINLRFQLNFSVAITHLCISAMPTPQKKHTQHKDHTDHIEITLTKYTYVFKYRILLCTPNFAQVFRFWF